MKTSDMLLTLLIIAVIIFGLYWIIGSLRVDRQIETNSGNSSLEINVEDDTEPLFQVGTSSPVRN